VVEISLFFYKISKIQFSFLLCNHHTAVPDRYYLKYCCVIGQSVIITAIMVSHTAVTNLNLMVEAIFCHRRENSIRHRTNHIIPYTI
jgi:hypothetical protein